MPEIEALNAIASIAGSVSTVSVLLFIVFLLRRDLAAKQQEIEKERMRFENLLAIFLEDWKRQREDEREEDTIARRVSVTKNGTGL